MAVATADLLTLISSYLVAALQAAGALVPAPECPELLILAAANAH